MAMKFSWYSYLTLLLFFYNVDFCYKFALFFDERLNDAQFLNYQNFKN